MPRVPNKGSFVKGDPRCNYKGAPRTSNAVKALKKLTLEQYIKLINKYLAITITEMKLIAENPKTSILELAIIAIFKRCIETGSVATLEIVLSRLIGKPENVLSIRGQMNHQSIAEYINEKKDK